MLRYTKSEWLRSRHCQNVGGNMSMSMSMSMTEGGAENHGLSNDGNF